MIQAVILAEDWRAALSLWVRSISKEVEAPFAPCPVLSHVDGETSTWVVTVSEIPERTLQEASRE